MKKNKWCIKIIKAAIFLWIICAILGIFFIETHAFSHTMGAWEYFPGGRICMGDGTDCTLGYLEPPGF